MISTSARGRGKWRSPSRMSAGADHHPTLRTSEAPLGPMPASPIGGWTPPTPHPLSGGGGGGGVSPIGGGGGVDLLPGTHPDTHKGRRNLHKDTSVDLGPAPGRGEI